MTNSKRDGVDATASPAPRRVQMIVNPCAGGWRERLIAALQASFEDAGATVSITSALSGELTIESGIQHVCAVGGDGTVRIVARAAVQADPRPSISVYPLGTVNLLARECGYVTDARAFVRRALARPARRHWWAQVGETPMLTCASVGPDSWTVNSVSLGLKRWIGRGAYVAALVGLLVRWPRPQLTLVAEGRQVRCEAVYVAKGRLFAGPWSFAPSSSVEDPFLHVVALPSCTRFAFARFAWSVLRARDAGDVIRFRCSSLTISSDEPVPVQADGDVVTTLPVTIKVADRPLVFS